MYPMSLYESGESNGKVSLKDLFNNLDAFVGCKSDLSVVDLIFSICRGGWPRSLENKTPQSKLLIAEDLFYQLCSVDIGSIDGVKRNEKLAREILRSYSRNICTLAPNTTLYKDIKNNFDVATTTFYEYLNALEELYILEDVDAWCPSIRSKSSIRHQKKRNLIDPSIAVAALGLKPEYFYKDFQTLGFLFESLCLRDLKIYSTALGGDLSYYHDRYNLESDGVLHLGDGRYALIEVKLGDSKINEGAGHLNQIEDLIIKHNNEDEAIPLSLPTLKIVITGTEYGYKREDGVLVIPIGCLRD